MKSAHHLSVLFLVLFFVFYLIYWVMGNTVLLFDPFFQNDDARTLLFPFHLYGSDGGLANSVLAREMLNQNLPALRFLYFVFVKLTNIFWASKIVQAICFLIVFASGLILARSRRFGLAGGILLVFLFLHNSNVVNRIAGGLPRSFGFPILSLWAASVLANKKWMRWVSCFIASLFYQPVMLILLAAEGIFCMRKIISNRFRLTFLWRSVGAYVLLSMVCLSQAFVAFLFVEGTGHLYSLEQAGKNQALSREGFLSDLEGIPFANPAELFAKHFLSPFRNLPNSSFEKGEQRVQKFMFLSSVEMSDGAAFLFVVFLMMLFLSRKTPQPGGLTELILASMAIYILSRFFAFYLYFPERYYYFGMTAAGTLLAISAMGQLLPQLKKDCRFTCRNLLAVFFMSVLLATSGGGVFPDNGVTIEGYSRRNLFDFIRTLPGNVHILAHPMEGDDILYWAGRDTMGGYETLHLLHVELWERRKKEIEQVFDAVYSVNPRDFMAYCKKSEITHVLVNKAYYQYDFKTRALYLEPFRSYARELLKAVKREDLLLTRIPPQAVIYEENFYQLVDLSLWEPIGSER